MYDTNGATVTTYNAYVTLVNADHDSIFSEYVDEHPRNTTGELYRDMRSEFGRCTGKLYRDTSSGPTQVGWVFESRDTYGDHGAARRRDTYIRHAWIEIIKNTCDDDTTTI